MNEQLPVHDDFCVLPHCHTLLDWLWSTRRAWAKVVSYQGIGTALAQHVQAGPVRRHAARTARAAQGHSALTGGNARAQGRLRAQVNHGGLIQTRAEISAGGPQGVLTGRRHGPLVLVRDSRLRGRCGAAQLLSVREIRGSGSLGARDRGGTCVPGGMTNRGTCCPRPRTMGEWITGCARSA